MLLKEIDVGPHKMQMYLKHAFCCSCYLILLEFLRTRSILQNCTAQSAQSWHFVDSIALPELESQFLTFSRQNRLLFPISSWQKESMKTECLQICALWECDSVWQTIGPLNVFYTQDFFTASWIKQEYEKVHKFKNCEEKLFLVKMLIFK